MTEETKIQVLEDRILNLENLIFRIMNFLAIDTDKSKCYNFINDDLVRRQLELDHILMLKTPALDFNQYCQYALFQIENLLNYYYTKRFLGTPDSANSYFNENPVTEEDLENIKTLDYRVSKIKFSTKLYKFHKEFMKFGKEYSTYLNINKIAYVRNTTLHRNTADVEAHENETLEKYIPIKNKKYSDLTSKEEKNLLTLGQKIEFKRSFSFAQVNRTLSEFLEIIQPEILKYQDKLITENALEEQNA